MAQLITTYDTGLKKKIFEVKGEEGYARTTDCRLIELEREADWNTHMEYMLIGFHVDVLRDIGASTVALYDNDVLIEGTLVDLDTNSHSIDFYYDDTVNPPIDTRIKLNYEVEHHIVAKYNGNKQCLPSESKEYVFIEPIPQAYESALTINGLDESYGRNDVVSFTVTLGATDHYDNQKIKVYDNGTLIDEYTTDEYGVTDEITITPSDDGIHTIRAVFEGNTTQYQELAYSEVSQEISVGYIVSIIDAPVYLINQDDYISLTAKVEDYYSNPVPDLSVDIGGWDALDGTLTTDSEGTATFNYVDPIRNHSYYAYVTIDEDYYLSTEYTTALYDNVTVSVTATPTIMSTNYSSMIEVQLSENVKDIPVQLTVSSTAIIYNKTYNLTTNENGNCSVTINGANRGDTTITASITGASDSVTIEDVYQYWNLSTPMNIGYELNYGSITKMTKGWKFATTGRGVIEGRLNSSEDLFDFTIEYDIVSNSGMTATFVGNYAVQSLTLKANDHIKQVFDYSNDTAKLYKNGTLLATVEWSEYPTLGFFTTLSQTEGNIIIKDLKFKKVDNE